MKKVSTDGKPPVEKNTSETSITIEAEEDFEYEIRDKDGNVIPNVYAIGETATSQLFGDYYFGGYSLGSYTTEGRIAAKDAVSSLAE